MVPEFRPPDGFQPDGVAVPLDRTDVGVVDSVWLLGGELVSVSKLGVAVGWVRSSMSAVRPAS